MSNPENMSVEAAAYALKNAIVAWDKKQGNRDAETQEIQRILNRLGFNKGQQEAFIELIKAPGGNGVKAALSVVELGKTRAEQQMEILKQIAFDIQDGYAKQGKAITGMASLFRTLASLCSAFGYEEGAQYLHAVADKETEKAQPLFARGREALGQLNETGEQAIREGLLASLRIAEDPAIRDSTVRIAQSAAEAPTVQLTGGGTNTPPTAPPPTQQRQRTVTINEFRENLAKMGVDRGIVNNIVREIGTVAQEVGKKEAVDAPIEMRMLPEALTKGGLTAAQQVDLYKRMKLPEPTPT